MIFVFKVSDIVTWNQCLNFLWNHLLRTLPSICSKVLYFEHLWAGCSSSVFSEVQGQEEKFAVIWAKRWWWLGLGGSGGRNETWSDREFVLNVEPTEFLMGLYVVCEKKKLGEKNPPRCLSWAAERMEQTAIRADFKRKSWSFPLTLIFKWRCPRGNWVRCSQEGSGKEIKNWECYLKPRNWLL